MADVVAVAHVGDSHALEPAESLADGHHVRERLAGVEVVGQAVDDRHVGVLGELVDVRLAVRPDEDRVEIPREDHGRVLDRLRRAEVQLAEAEVERSPSEVAHAGLERARVSSSTASRRSSRASGPGSRACSRGRAGGSSARRPGRAASSARRPSSRRPEEVAALQVFSGHAAILSLPRLATKALKLCPSQDIQRAFDDVE